MILSDLKDYLRSHEQVSLRDVAVRFDVSEAAAAGMLEHWERKGMLKRIDNPSCANVCGHDCASCPMQCSALYRWTEG